MTSPVPPGDTARVDALRALRILDTEREQAFDDLARLAATLCSAPVAWVSFVDAEREWAKAVVGLADPGLAGERPFGARAIAAPGGVLEVPDAEADPGWADHPMVVGRPWLRSYAGAAIVTADGHALGAVAVADHEPRRMGPAALEGLAALARQAAALLELRRHEGWRAAAGAEADLRAAHDALTGLPTRAVLHDRLGQALRVQLRTHDDVGLVACDLDGFRGLNDLLGHALGDQVLQVVAERMAGVARASDTLCRVAGDEWVLLCPAIGGARNLDRVRERLRVAVEQPLTLEGTSFVPRLSSGAVLAEPGERPEAVLKRAGAALRTARRAAEIR